MMKERLIYLLTAYDCIQSINDYIDGYELVNFLEDKKTQDAVIRNIEVLGQTFTDFGIEALQQKYPDIQWREITRIGTITSYKSLGVDNKVTIWETVSRQQLSPYQDALGKLLIAIQGE